MIKQVLTQFSLPLGNLWDQSQFLNPGSYCLLPILIMLEATNWQLRHLQGLKTNLDSTYLSSSGRHLPQRGWAQARRRGAAGGGELLVSHRNSVSPFTSISCLKFKSRLFRRWNHSFSVCFLNHIIVKLFIIILLGLCSQTWVCIWHLLGFGEH